MNLALLLLFSCQDACVPATVERLTADDIAVREQAVDDLVKRGSNIIPAVRRALAAATDAELKGRLETVLKALTEIRWMTDLGAAQKAAAEQKRPLLVYATRGPLNGWS